MRRTATIVALTLAGALAVGTAPASATPPSTVKCGDTLTRSVRLTADLTDCPGDGLVIGAPASPSTSTATRSTASSPRSRTATSPRSGSAASATAAATTGSRSRTARSSSSAPASTRARTRRGWPTAPSATSSRATTASAASSWAADRRVNNDNRIVGNTVYGNGCGAGIALTSGRRPHRRQSGDDNDSGVVICCSDGNVVRDNVTAHNADAGIEVCCGRRLRHRRRAQRGPRQCQQRHHRALRCR